jgi:hypothetical protein
MADSAADATGFRNPGPMARLDEFIEREDAMSQVAQRIADGETLLQIATSMEVPYSKLFEWISDDADRTEKYARAKRLWAGARADKVSVIADGLDGDPTKGRVSAAKVQIDANLRLAKIWDRERYGDQVSVSGNAKANLLPADRDSFLLELARNVGWHLSLASAIKDRQDAQKSGPALLSAPEKEVVGSDAPVDVPENEDPI